MSEEKKFVKVFDKHERQEQEVKEYLEFLGAYDAYKDLIEQMKRGGFRLAGAALLQNQVDIMFKKLETKDVMFKAETKFTVFKDLLNKLDELNVSTETHCGGTHYNAVTYVRFTLPIPAEATKSD
jgi:hypothetical protein